MRGAGAVFHSVSQASLFGAGLRMGMAHNKQASINIEKKAILHSPSHDVPTTFPSLFHFLRGKLVGIWWEGDGIIYQGALRSNCLSTFGALG
jgi:hypothetical protein